MSLMFFYFVIFVYDLFVVWCFYGEVFGLSEGCFVEYWVDFDFFGYQLVIYQYLQIDFQCYVGSNLVDGYDVLVLYFGVVFVWDDWYVLVECLQQCGICFVIEFYICFKGQVGEQVMLFFFDFCGNVLEFKSFCDMGQLFVK